MSIAQDQLNQVVVAVSASDPNQVMHVGVMRSYIPEPCAAIELRDGDWVHWIAGICRPATDSETIDYWRRRAEIAEAALQTKP